MPAGVRTRRIPSSRLTFFGMWPIRAIIGQPLDLAHDLGSQLYAAFTNREAFVINPTFTGDDVKMAASDGRVDNTVAVDIFFEAAQAAASAEIFPLILCHEICFPPVRWSR